MTTEEKKENDKVVSLAAVRENKAAEPPVTGAEAESYFQMVEKMNKEKQERLKKERNRDNKGVLRSYRIKH